MTKLDSFFGLLSIEFDFIVLPNNQIIIFIIQTVKILVIMFNYRATLTDIKIALRALCNK